MKHLGDITKINGAEVPPVKVVIGGSPCQDLSIAGKREGLKGERSGLFMEQIRIIKEMRTEDIRCGRKATDIRPRYMVWENVPGAFSSHKGADFKAVLEETVGIVEEIKPDIPIPKEGWHYSGCIMGDGYSVAWRVFDAQFWGVPQRRRRIALVADFGGQSAPEILFERKGVSRYTPPSRTPWEDFAKTVKRRFNSADRKSVGAGIAYSFDSLSSNSMKSNNPNSGYRKVDVAKTVDTTIPNPSKNQGGVAIVYNGENITNKFNAANPKPNDPCHTLNATGSNRSLCVSYSYQALREYKESPVSSTLSARDYKSAKDLCMCVRERCGCEGSGKGCLVQEDQSGALATNNDQFVCALDRAAFNQGINAQYNPEISESGINSTLTAKGPGTVCESVVRRLTPLECERLQGFPDNWTNIGDYIDSEGKNRKTSDTARYKALGNSIALPSWVWVLERLSFYCDNDRTMASLFDGIGGFPLIWETLNGQGTCLWTSEIEEFPIAVTKYHFKGENNDKQIYRTTDG